jgi:hypothetical protein
MASYSYVYHSGWGGSNVRHRISKGGIICFQYNNSDQSNSCSYSNYRISNYMPWRSGMEYRIVREGKDTSPWKTYDQIESGDYSWTPMATLSSTRIIIEGRDAGSPPSPPGTISGVSQDALYMIGENILLNWVSSTDPEGDAITYEMEFTKDGSTWTSLQTGISATTFNHIFTNDDTDVGQFRVRAKDSKGGYSGYTLSPKFKTRRKLLLIKDGESFKTFKSGSWQII